MSLECKPWIEMWFRPRKTIQAIVEFSPNYGLKVLAFIYGLASLLSLAQTFSWGFYLGFFPLISLIVIAAPFWGYLVFNIASWVVYQTGRWLKGKATHFEVRSVIAWSNIPMTVNLVAWVVFLCIFKGTLFQGFPGTYLTQGKIIYLLFSMSLLQLSMGIWTLVLYLQGLSQVQGFSIGRAILNLLIAGLILVVLFTVFSMVAFWVMEFINRTILKV